jgi:hypothetical protein
MADQKPLTDAELAALRARRPGVRASLAIEGLQVCAATEAQFEAFDQARLTMAEREARLIAQSRARRALRTADAAE